MTAIQSDGTDGRLLARARRAALYGGPLWIGYGIFEILQPFGRDTVFDATREYDVVVDRGLFTLYSLPGSVALLVSAGAILSLLTGATRRPRLARAGRMLAWIAVGLAAVSVAGVGTALDPLFTGPRIVGTLALGAAACVAAPCLKARGLFAPMAALGVAGVGMLAIWPLVYAVEVMPRSAGAAMIAGFGLGWVATGRRLSGHPSAGRRRWAGATALAVAKR